MPRQKNMKPTSIYWLMDIRPETIAAGWVQGLPFYCGKTIRTPESRLSGHRTDARRSSPGRVGPYVKNCGEQIRIVVLETVPPGDDWIERECHWIARSRQLFPDIMTNVSDGGAGAPGNIHTDETRVKIGNALRGRKISPEHWAKLCGQKRSPETCARISAAKQGKKCPKISAAKRGKKFSPEHCAKLSIAAKARRRKAFSPETRVKMSIAAKARCARQVAISEMSYKRSNCTI